MPSGRFRMLRPDSRTARVCCAGSAPAISPTPSRHPRPAGLATETQEASPRSDAPCLDPHARRDNHPFGPGIIRILAVAETCASGYLELHPRCSCSDQLMNSNCGTSDEFYRFSSFNHSGRYRANLEACVVRLARKRVLPRCPEQLTLQIFGFMRRISGHPSSLKRSTVRIKQSLN